MDAFPLTVTCRLPEAVILTFWSIVITTDSAVPFNPVAPSAGLVDTTFGAGSAGWSMSLLPPQATNASVPDTAMMNFLKSFMLK